MWQKKQIIMLPTDDKSNLYTYSVDEKLYQCTTATKIVNADKLR